MLSPRSLTLALLLLNTLYHPSRPSQARGFHSCSGRAPAFRLAFSFPKPLPAPLQPSGMWSSLNQALEGSPSAPPSAGLAWEAAQAGGSWPASAADLLQSAQALSGPVGQHPQSPGQPQPAWATVQQLGPEPHSQHHTAASKIYVQASYPAMHACGAMKRRPPRSCICFLPRSDRARAPAFSLLQGLPQSLQHPVAVAGLFSPFGDVLDVKL